MKSFTLWAVKILFIGLFFNACADKVAVHEEVMHSHTNEVHTIEPKQDCQENLVKEVNEEFISQNINDSIENLIALKLEKPTSKPLVKEEQPVIKKKNTTKEKSKKIYKTKIEKVKKRDINSLATKVKVPQKKKLAPVKKKSEVRKPIEPVVKKTKNENLLKKKSDLATKNAPSSLKNTTTKKSVSPDTPKTIAKKPLVKQKKIVAEGISFEEAEKLDNTKINVYDNSAKMLKSPGDKVCRNAKGLLSFDTIYLIGYVEAKKREDIKVRIKGTFSENKIYNGHGLYRNTIIWDKNDNWELCSLDVEESL